LNSHAKSKSVIKAFACLVPVFASTIAPVFADGVAAPAAVSPSTIAGSNSLNDASAAPTIIAQAAPPPIQPIDLTPVRLPERGGAFSTMQNLRTGVLYALPAKMFFNLNVENSLRLETNVFQTTNNQKTTGVYRVLPDVTVGYAPTKKTRLSAGYFFFRDTYIDHAHSLDRNVNSVQVRADRDFYLSPTTVLTTSLVGRELFVTQMLPVSDIQPVASLVKRVGTYGAAYGQVLGQFRFHDVLKEYQEFDQFYSAGYIYRKPKWALLSDVTLIDEFGKGDLRGGGTPQIISPSGIPGVAFPSSNHLIVLTLEANRRISSRVPLVAFVRAQPIFNFGQQTRQGFAGVDFRLFGGLRLEISKPAIFPVKLRSS
jgi:hypothetical protein